MAERTSGGSDAIRKLIGGVLVLAAAAGAAVGGFWALMKASGAEVDLCTGGGGECTSGWYPALAFLSGAVVAGALGVRLLRRRATDP